MHFYIQWLETWADDQSLISKPLRTLEMQYSDLKFDSKKYYQGDYHLIQQQILKMNFKRNARQTVRRISIKILGINGFKWSLIKSTKAKKMLHSYTKVSFTTQITDK